MRSLRSFPVKRTKSDVDDLAAIAQRIAVKLERVLADEINALKSPIPIKSVVHATVVGLLRGSLYAAAVNWFRSGGVFPDRVNEAFVDLIQIELLALQSMTKTAGIILEQDVKAVSFGKTP